ncbi:sulfur oxidation c-type cytochrome SoxX [Rhizobiales bacterium]|uniref:sulfur oxidation c-type cytochrome SoxX n=1 Tax=Hongsoonwoonella zoysiae TaxID=2821844 RepID=UPI0015602439|nr:sulfur oxidation c-type cytochrome SoxX [Hongsoonwoonella zoysiae]NRG19308.1 sulfur oxidation c-type cytochrome SoxX [Hongsoonwoonella zoysiae]
MRVRPTFALCAATFLVGGILAAGAAEVAPDKVVFKDDFEVVDSLTGQPGDPMNGREVFADRKLGNCLACHVNSDMAELPFHGEVGPEIDGVASRYKPAQLRAIVVNSKKVFGSETIMPSFYRLENGARPMAEFQGKTILTAQQVEDVVAYLTTLSD